MTNEQIARVCHEANRGICAAHGELQPTWRDAEQWQRDSAILGVLSVRMNPHISPAELHERWMQQKLKDGWTLGPEKNPRTKTHPCLVPYADLPEHQRVKDYVFRAICLTLINMSDLQVDIAQELGELASRMGEAALKMKEATSRIEKVTSGG